MSDNPTDPVPPPPLLAQLESIFQSLRARDRTIKKYDREMQTQADAMRRAHALRKIARGAQKKHEAWLREEAAMIVRKRNGVRTIPGFASTRESAIAFRQALNEKHRAAARAAKAILDSDTPPPA
ncbi:MAG: hypothetical protein QG602_2463 [Verrucomicrobiota bacterium]|nr:hypothetical protein [Verrucomicrobiota bacterium]